MFAADAATYLRVDYSRHPEAFGRPRHWQHGPEEYQNGQDEWEERCRHDVVEDDDKVAQHLWLGHHGVVESEEQLHWPRQLLEELIGLWDLLVFKHAAGPEKRRQEEEKVFVLCSRQANGLILPLILLLTGCCVHWLVQQQLAGCEVPGFLSQRCRRRETFFFLTLLVIYWWTLHISGVSALFSLLRFFIQLIFLQVWMILLVVSIFCLLVLIWFFTNLFVLLDVLILLWVVVLMVIIFLALQKNKKKNQTVHQVTTIQRGITAILRKYDK